MMRGVRDFIDCAIERFFVCSRRLGETAQFTDELQRRRANFVIRRRWTEIMQGFNVSAHAESLTADAVLSKVEPIARMKTDFLAPQISRPPFSILREIVGDRVPRCAVIDERMKLRPNSGIIIESAHANRHLFSVRPITAEQTRPAIHTKRFHRAFAFPVNLD
jgi:hypothetical protein